MLPDPVIQEIDSLLSRNYPADGPGAAVIITQDGAPLYRKGFGLANLDWYIPVEPDTLFKIGSVTKQFTAVAILMLLEQGKLDLQDPIEKYLPGYPTHGHTITIEHLLTHTSGIYSYTDAPDWMEKLPLDFTLEQMIDSFKFKPMGFAPGRRWSYNNSAYFMLGAIIQKVSGQSYEDFLKEHIFDLLEMHQTFGYTGQRVLPKRVSGYVKSPEGWVNAPYVSMTHPGAAGVMSSTVDDLARWDAALYTEKLVSQESLRKAWTPYTLLDGKSTYYGYGWSIEQLRDALWITHGGGIFGFVCHVTRVPSEKLFVAVLSNNSGADKMPGELAFRLANLALGSPVPEPKAVDLTMEQLERMAGVYDFGPGDERTMLVKEGKLVMKFAEGGFNLEMVPLSETEFTYQRFPLSRVRFTQDESGLVTGAETINDYGRVDGEGKRIEKPIPNIEEKK